MVMIIYQLHIKRGSGCYNTNPEHLNKFNKNIILVEDTLEALNKLLNNTESLVYQWLLLLYTGKTTTRI